MEELASFDRWLSRTETKLDGGKIKRPESIVDACQALKEKTEKIKKLSDVYLSKIEALCVLWASGQVNADIQSIEKALQASGSKVKMTGEDLKACVTEIQQVLVA